MLMCVDMRRVEGWEMSSGGCGEGGDGRIRWACGAFCTVQVLLFVIGEYYTFGRVA